ncbi:MAG: DCC1-like thiol-disulfide oxidoreductase family protein [Bdellovibrionaceae bacterium]|nr:DCC1-like thiol-disulfide oxidoreductase family protein [Pseudobdellovibrionaceae bacterium]
MPRIIFFDGPCRLCNGFVNSILKIDRSKTFKFSSLQSATAQKLLPQQDLSLGSVVYFDGHATTTKSAAVVQILRELNGFFSFLGFMIWLIPPPIRDAVYDLIARNRYRIFGKDEVCQLPPPGSADRFLD